MTGSADEPSPAFGDDDLDARLDAAVEAAGTAPPEEMLATLTTLRGEVEAAVERFPASPDPRDDLGRCLAATGWVQARLRHFDTAVETTRAAIGAHAAAAEMDPVGESRAGPLASLHLRCAHFLDDIGRLDEAIAESSAAVSIAETAATQSESDGEIVLRLRGLAADACRTSSSLRSRLGEPAEAADDLDRALEHRRRVLAAAPTDGESVRSVAGALREVAWARREIGDGERALTSLREARALLEGGASREPAELAWQRDLAITRAITGLLLRDTRRIDEARAELDAATFLTETLASLDPGDEDTRSQLLRRLEEQGDLQLAAGDSAGARAAYERRLDACRRLAPDDPRAEARARMDLASARHASEDLAGAISEVEAACARLEAGPDDDVDLRAELANALARLADLRAESEATEAAIEARRRAVEVQRAVHARVPSHDRGAETLAILLHQLGELLRDRGDLAEAEAAYRESVDVVRARLTRKGPASERLQQLAVAEASLANAISQQDRAADSVPHAAAALEARLAALALDPEDLGLALRAVWDRRRAGTALAAAGQPDAAARILRDAIAAADAGRADPEAGPEWLLATAAAHDALGDVLLADDDVDGALAEGLAEADLAHRWAVTLDSDVGAWNNAAVAHRDAGMLLRRVGRLGDAIEAISAAIDARERIERVRQEDEARRDLSVAVFERGRIRAEAGDHAAALADAQRSLRIDEDVLSRAPADRSAMYAVAASHHFLSWVAAKLERHELAEASARGHVTVCRGLSAEGNEDDRRELRWAMYSLGAALRSLARGPEAQPVLREALDLTEARLAEAPDDLDALGLLGNVREVFADVLDRADPAAREQARRWYEANREIYRAHTAEELGHEADCTCLADNERKLAELEATDAAADVRGDTAPAAQPDTFPATEGGHDAAEAGGHDATAAAADRESGDDGPDAG